MINRILIFKVFNEHFFSHNGYRCILDSSLLFEIRPYSFRILSIAKKFIKRWFKNLGCSYSESVSIHVVRIYDHINRKFQYCSHTFDKFKRLTAFVLKELVRRGKLPPERPRIFHLGYGKKKNNHFYVHHSRTIGQ